MNPTQGLAGRHRFDRWGKKFFWFTNGVALGFLILLLGSIINTAFGSVAVEYAIRPEVLSEQPLETLTPTELAQILEKHAPGRIRVLIRDTLAPNSKTEFVRLPLKQLMPKATYPTELANNTINKLTTEQHLALLSDNLNQKKLATLVQEEVVQPKIVDSWTLWESLVENEEIQTEVAQTHPNADLRFQAWINWRFITSSISSSATTAGLRTALIGTVWIISITALVALPIGVGAAIYLEEYADKNSWLGQLIETNIRNLAGVPSIIYGMLGLATFVHFLHPLTSGAIFGVTDSNGRTILSAGLTLALLTLPVIIINAQEAIRAVPNSLREASYGLGATRWQTVSRVVLPIALPGIMTGMILSLSRAIGETAPLIVVGASTFIGVDPNGLFSKFTAIPIQIYQWTSRPEAEFKNLAAAAILVLFLVLFTMNGIAIYFRQRSRVRL